MPSLSMLATEPLRALFDHFGAHVAAAPEAVGDGHPVVVYPGLGAGAFNTSHLRSYLTSSGFAAHDWECGVNTGPEGMFDDWLGPLDDRVRELHRAHGRKVSLVGWSLGGLYAREIAKRSPESVRQVISLGTPFTSEPRLRACPPVPTTSIYSKSDGIVSWRGCVEKHTPRSESIEVSASHLGMVSSEPVLRLVAERLAQPEGRWRTVRRVRA